MGHSLLNLNIIMKKSLYNLYFIILFNSAPPLFRNPRGVTKATLCATCCCSCCRVLIPYLTTLAFGDPRGATKATLRATCCCSCCRVLIPYLTTLAFGDPRGANYVRTTRDLSPLVLSSKENSVFFTSTNFPIHRGDRRQAG